MYKLPQGIRVPNDDEYPNDYDAEDINSKRLNANIEEGFSLQLVSDEKFSFYAEINADEDKLWDLFCTMVDELVTEPAYLILGFKDQDSWLSNFMSKKKLIDVIKEYHFEFTNDGFLALGIASNSEGKLSEVYLTSYKYFNVWGTDVDSFKSIMNRFEIYEDSTLNFIDKFPVVSEALDRSKYKHAIEIIDELKLEFI